MVRIGRLSSTVWKFAVSLPVVAVISSYTAVRLKEDSVSYAAETLGVTRLRPTVHEQQIARKVVEIQSGLRFDQKDFVEFLKDTRRDRERLWHANLELTRLRLCLALGLPEGASHEQMVKVMKNAQRQDDREVRSRVINVFEPANNHFRQGTNQLRYWKVMWAEVTPFVGNPAKVAGTPDGMPDRSK